MGWKNHTRAVLLALLGVHVLAQLDRNMLLGFAPEITHDLTLNNAQYGFLNGAVWVFSFGVMAVVLGSLADRFSRTRVMTAGILIWSICTAASGAAQNFEQMAAARFFVATGEAALVPAAVSLLTELFDERARGGAMGIFFMGIPLGLGLAFALAGVLSGTFGWRGSYVTLGALGAVIGLISLLATDVRPRHDPAERGAPLPQQIRNVFSLLRGNRTLTCTVIGFVIVNMAFVGIAFEQLWLVRERGLGAAAAARVAGGLGIISGVLGAVVGGLLSDRLSRHLPGGHAGFVVLLILICGPLMVAYRFANPGAPLFYAGMCAGFFLAMAAYGPSIALIQGLTPGAMRSTITGVTMLLINLFAVAAGNLAVGAISDHLVAAGSHHALTHVLLATDCIAILGALFYVAAARSPMVPPIPVLGEVG